MKIKIKTEMWCYTCEILEWLCIYIHIHMYIIYISPVATNNVKNNLEQFRIDVIRNGLTCVRKGLGTIGATWMSMLDAVKYQQYISLNIGIMAFPLTYARKEFPGGHKVQRKTHGPVHLALGWRLLDSAEQRKSMLRWCGSTYRSNLLNHPLLEYA